MKRVRHGGAKAAGFEDVGDLHLDYKKEQLQKRNELLSHLPPTTKSSGGSRRPLG